MEKMVAMRARVAPRVFQNDDLSDATVARAGDRAGEDDDACKDRKCCQKLNDVSDLEQHLTYCLKRSCDVNDGDRWKVLVENATQLCGGRRVAMDTAVPDNWETCKRGMGKTNSARE